MREFNLETLFKKANLKNNKNFLNRKTWKVNNNYVSIYAKDTGRANNENSYELPPPIDSKLYFGNLIIVKHTEENINNNNVVDLTLEEWEKMYEKIIWRFEDLGDEDSYSEEEVIPEKYKTKEGYSKEDGFIVDDDDEEDEEYEPEDEEEYNSDNDTSEPDEQECEELGSEIEESEKEDEKEEDYEDDDDDDLDSIGSELSESSYMTDEDSD